jgi:hypothetical protein
MINLLPNLSTNHNLCFKSLIWECDFILFIYFSKPFIWSKEGPRRWSSKPWIKSFKYVEIHKVRIHTLRVWGLFLSTLSHTCGSVFESWDNWSCWQVVVSMHWVHEITIGPLVLRSLICNLGRLLILRFMKLHSQNLTSLF